MSDLISRRMNDLISRRAAIDTMVRLQTEDIEMYGCAIPEGFDGDRAAEALKALPSAQPERETERLTKEDIETIRIHMNAIKERLCNQHRWEEAEEYQQIVDKLDKMMELEHDEHEE